MKIIGTNFRSLPLQVGFDTVQGFFMDGQISVGAVLVEGDIGDYAAYIGSGCKEFIAKHGDKLSFNEAKIHFPSIIEQNYRT